MTLPRLSRDLVLSAASAGRTDVRFPAPALLDLPERVVQFGTGALLRGLIEPLIDDANARGEFGGRILAFGSTGSGREQSLTHQDGLFTLAARGVVDGAQHGERRVVASLSRALTGDDGWREMIHLARNGLQLVFSNTTEAGFVLTDDDTGEGPIPRSFPGKLTSLLWEFALSHGFSWKSRLVVLPCELVENNGSRLREMVLELSRRQRLPARFDDWIRRGAVFCDTLVDRIVPGTPARPERMEEEAELGYRDTLLTVAEPYALFAIQASEEERGLLPFADDPRVVITSDITPYRERKLRLLNGTHTAMVPVALLCGCETVRQAVEDAEVGAFIRRVMLDEIAPFVAAPDAEGFAHAVLDRFANPHLRHAVADIALQQTMKLRVRVVPSILAHAAATGEAPASLAFAFAAYLRLARGDVQAQREAAGRPLPRDGQGARIHALWREAGDESPCTIARRACADAETWGADLTAVPGFVDKVAACLSRILAIGAPAALAQHLARASAAPLTAGSR